MHHTQALHTLLQCLEDLTGTINQFGKEHQLHEVEKDLLLYRSRLLYEAILALPALTASQLESLQKNKVDVAERMAKISPTQPKPAGPPTETTPEATENTVQFAEKPEAKPLAKEKAIEEKTTAIPEAKAAVEAEEATPTVSPDAEENVHSPAIEMQPTAEADKEAITDETPATDEMAATISNLHFHIPAKEDKATVNFEQFSIKSILQQNGDKDLILTHLKLKPIQDLKSGIGLNEKFLFIRELFDNDHQAYADAVSNLNAAGDLAQAEEIIGKTLMPHYQWQADNEAVVNFLHLVLRRFSA